MRKMASYRSNKCRLIVFLLIMTLPFIFLIAVYSCTGSFCFRTLDATPVPYSDYEAFLQGKVLRHKFNTSALHRVFKLDLDDSDIMVYLHIQKTGGAAFGRHLVHNLNLNLPCSCVPEKKKCDCTTKSKKIWLLSRHSTGWVCGLHADWTELNDCVDEWFKKNDHSPRNQRRYHYLTFLRNPVNRFLSEWQHVRRGATWKAVRLHCNGRDATLEEVPFCFSGSDWSGVSFEDFVSCPHNLEHSTEWIRMLPNLSKVNCYNKTKRDEKLGLQLKSISRAKEVPSLKRKQSSSLREDSFEDNEEMDEDEKQVNYPSKATVNILELKEDRLYRKNYTKENEKYNPEDDELFAEDHSTECNDDELCDSSLNIVETKRGLSLSVAVPNFFYKYIIGKGGEAKRQLETETSTQILIPSKRDREEIIVINGTDRKGLISAKTRIDVIMDSVRQRQPFTHFLSIPVCSEAICKRFEEFKSEILEKCSGDRGFDASLFQNPKRLHFTLGTLVLLSNDDIKRATELLFSCQKDLLGQPTLQDKKLTVQICGLEYMNDDPSEVDVLYAKLLNGETSKRLQNLVDYITEKFQTSGLMKKEYDRVKLHVTVINTLMRKDPTGVFDASKPGTKARESFDASRILKEYNDFDFGPLHIDSIHLSQRYTTSKTGYYESASYITL
ncbi:activating signal cointegrator 1 complex subunit [Bulinus truncatus]|nr:activating signal cointegrator 1 complex subunit [Bulinus truncatus]